MRYITTHREAMIVMKTVIGCIAMLALFFIFYLNAIPGYIKKNYDALCPESQPVIINGEFKACTGDKEQSPANTWIPGKRGEKRDKETTFL